MSTPKHKASEVPPAPAAQAAPPPPPVAASTAPVAQSSFKFALEDDIPFPEKRTMSPRGETMYPFTAMKIGQSFFVPASDRIKEPWKTLTSMASRQSRQLHPKVFTSSRTTVDGVEGARVWRKPDTDKPLGEPRKINRKPRKDARNPEAPAEVPAEEREAA